MNIAGGEEPTLLPVRVFSSSSSGSDSDYVIRSGDDAEDETWGQKLEPKRQKRSKAKRRKSTHGYKHLDPEGERCHYCRHSSCEDHVSCSRCVIKFCGRCLLNRHGERIKEEMRKSVQWVCPRCRGGCGPGCKNCCTCVPCRKSQGLKPTGQIVRIARSAGFSNVHDYLVHLETGEEWKVITRRKEGRRWTKATGARVKSLSVEEEDEDIHPAWARKRVRSSRKRLVFRLSSRWIKRTSVRDKIEDKEQFCRDNQDTQADCKGSGSHEQQSQTAAAKKEDKEQRYTTFHLGTSFRDGPSLTKPHQYSTRQFNANVFTNKVLSYTIAAGNIGFEEQAQGTVYGKAGQSFADDRSLRLSQRFATRNADAENTRTALLNSKHALVTNGLEEQVHDITHKKTVNSCGDDQANYSQPPGSRNFNTQLLDCSNDSEKSIAKGQKQNNAYKMRGLLPRSNPIPGRSQQYVTNKGDAKYLRSLPVDCPNAEESKQVEKGKQGTDYKLTWKSPGHGLFSNQSKQHALRKADTNTSTSQLLDYRTAADRNGIEGQKQDHAYDLTGKAQRDAPSPSHSQPHVVRNDNARNCVAQVLDCPDPASNGVEEINGNTIIFIKSEKFQREDSCHSQLVTKEADARNSTCQLASCITPDGLKEQRQTTVDGKPEQSHRDGRRQLDATRKVSQSISVDLLLPCTNIAGIDGVEEQKLLTVHQDTRKKDCSVIQSWPFVTRKADVRNSRCQLPNCTISPESNNLEEHKQDSIIERAVKFQDVTLEMLEEGFESLSSIQPYKFRCELELLYERPFSLQQLRRMWEHVATHRPVIQLGHIWGRPSEEEQCGDEGPLYLDHYPDLAEKLSRAICLEEKLKLLRGFFFWLQHADMEGAYRPWVTSQDDEEEIEERMDISSPDSQAIDVLLAIDAMEDGFLKHN